MNAIKGDIIRKERTKRLGALCLVLVLVMSAFAVMPGHTTGTEDSELFEESPINIELVEPGDGAEGVEIPDMYVNLSVMVTHEDEKEMNVTFYGNESGGDLEERYENSSVESGGYANFTAGPLDYGMEIEWYVNVTEAYDEENYTESEIWTFTTEHIPNMVRDPEYPGDGAVNVEIAGKNTTLEVDVRHPEGADMNVTFYGNESGEDLEEIGSETEVEDGIVSMTWEDLEYVTTYEWYVNVTEAYAEENYTVSETWTFTTEDLINIETDSEMPEDGAVDVEISPDIQVDVSHSEGEDLNVTFYGNESGEDLEEIDNVTVEGDGTATVTWEDLEYGTTYEWYVNVSEFQEDADYRVSDTWTFTTVDIPNIITGSEVPEDGAVDVGIYPGMNTTLEVNVSHPEEERMNVTFYDGNHERIGHVTYVEDGRHNVTWEDLEYGTEYAWYVNVTEYREEETVYTESEIWTFTTEEVITEREPEHEAVVHLGEDMETMLRVNVTHPAGEEMNVTFFGNESGEELEWLYNETVESEEWAEFTWEDLEYGHEYEWYVNITYGEDDVLLESDEWTFMAEDIPNKIREPNYPPHGAEDVELDPELNVTARHPEGENVTVTFYGNDTEEGLAENDENELYSETVESGEDVTYVWEDRDFETTYYWQVNVSEENTNWTHSEIWSFTTRAPEMYELSLNITEGEGNITVEWDDQEENVTAEGTADEPWVHEFEENTEVTLTAVPDEGWYFAGWTGDYEGMDEEIVITMDEDKEINATFTDEVHDLTVIVEGEGTVTVEWLDQEESVTDEHTFEEIIGGTEVTLTAEADADWYFEEWTGDYEGEEEEITITMDDDKEITAWFEEDLAPAYFEVEITAYDDEVEEGDTVTVEFTVENTGDLEGTQTIVFYVDGDEEDSMELTIGAGESEDEEFTWETEEAGEYDLEVASDDTSDSVTVTVEEEVVVDEPNFEVTIDAPEDGAEFEEGDTVTVEFTIENTGDAEGTQDIVFNVDGTEEDSVEVTIEAGQDYSGEFEWEAEEAGEYELEVASDDDSDSVTVTVEEDEPIDMMMIAGIILIIIIILAIIAYMLKSGGTEAGPVLEEEEEEELFEEEEEEEMFEEEEEELFEEEEETFEEEEEELFEDEEEIFEETEETEEDLFEEEEEEL